jgi:putative Mg2+ transporter-C (MgtC) family protein
MILRFQSLHGFQFMNEFSPISWLVVVGRLLLAIALGAAIGLDREFGEKAAGLRTNMLVALGAALFVLVPVQSGLAAADATALARSLQGIITGVGFVGAGSILRADRVHGLTSATAVWISGLWQLGLVGAGFALAILRYLKFLEKQL